MSQALPQAVPQTITPVVRVSDLRQWVYCPRVAYFTLVCPLAKPETIKMQEGREKEARLARLQRRRTLAAFGLSNGTVEANVPLFSSQLGLTGKLDLLIRQAERRFPVEVKFARGPSRLNHQVQLAAYGLLLEDLFAIPVSHGYIVLLPDDQVERIELSPPLRTVVRSLITAVREMAQNQQMPPPNPIMARCTDCEYRNFCGDVV